MTATNTKKANNIKDNIIKWNGADVTVKPVLPITEAFSFVNKIVESCFTDDGDYIPEARRFVELIETIRAYTDITLPQTTEEQYEFVYSGDFVELLADHINEAQYLDLMSAAQDKINSRRRDKKRAIDMQMNDLYVSLKGVLSVAEAVFGDMDSTKVAKVIDNLAKSDLSEENLVKAILDARSKSEGLS